MSWTLTLIVWVCEVCLIHAFLDFVLFVGWPDHPLYFVSRTLDCSRYMFMLYILVLPLVTRI